MVDRTDRTNPRRFFSLLAACLELSASASAAGESHLPPPGAASCGACHSGSGRTPSALDKLTRDEIATALAAFRNGARDGTIMPRIAAGFTASESEAIAAALGRAEAVR